MCKRPFFLIGVLAVLVSLLPLGGLTRAQEPVQPAPSTIRRERPQVDPELRLQLQRELGAMKGPSKVVIELSDQATTQTFASAQASGASAAQATARAQAQLATVNAAQQTLQRTLTAPAIGAQVIYRTQRVLNAVAVRVDATKLQQIQALPGVKAVYPLVSKRLDNSTSVPFIGAPEVWNAAGLNTAGEGITIGIIDTGIDYLHTDFGGPGTQAAYDANNTTVLGDSPYFPNAKVAGGFDFVGDAYTGDNLPQPDPDPIDCNGHGTHVAGTAGGYGVNADGSTYTGTYGPNTDFGSLRIGPGVAPRVQLYALRVFGCEGSTDVVEAALEYSVDPNGDGDFEDRLDVVNMSLGSDFGTAGSALDTSALASDNAASAGVVVVASAGNSGDTYYITGSPATSSRTISVAATLDNGLSFLGIRINSPSAIAGEYEAAEASFGPALTEQGITGDVVYPATNQTGCDPFPPGTFNGQIALINRGGCEFSTKVFNAQEGGAIAVIIVNNVPGPPPGLGAGVDAPKVTIPSVAISQDDGALIKQQLAAGQTVNVTLSSSITIPRPDLADTLASFSSRGPRRGDNFLKPDIAAPGQNITSALTTSGSEPLTISGTSMAAPHVAGTMALLRQLHPDWRVEELKALAMNTATNDVRVDAPQDSPIYGPGRIGAGRVDVPNAAASQVIAYNADNPELVSVSFGNVEVVGTARIVKRIRVLNKSNVERTYNVEYRPVVDIPGVNYTLSQTSVTLQPFGSADVLVTMNANAANMKHTHDQTVSEVQAGLPRHWISEEAGYAVMTSTSNQPTLRVPLHAVARPASRMEAVTGTLPAPGATTTTGNIPLRGEDVLTGEDFPTDEVSIATAFELQHSSPNDLRTQGVADNADLKYLGVSTSLRSTATVTDPQGLVEDSALYFGIATHGDWTTPNEVFFEVYFDTDRDGADDFVLLNIDLATVTGGTDKNDVFITVLVDLNTGDAFLEDFLNGLPSSALNTVPFNTNVVMLPVYAADLGLTSQNSSFNYRVRTFSRDIGEDEEEIGVGDAGYGFADSSPVLAYDAARPGLDLSNPELAGLPAHFDLNGNNIPFVYDRAAFAANRSQGALILHHHNARGNRDEVIRQQRNFKLYLPLISNNDGDFN